MKAGKREKSRGPGRPKLYGPRILLPLADETLEAIDSSLGSGETRMDFIRKAIEAELARRLRRRD